MATNQENLDKRRERTLPKVRKLARANGLPALKDDVSLCVCAAVYTLDVEKILSKRRVHLREKFLTSAEDAVKIGRELLKHRS